MPGTDGSLNRMPVTRERTILLAEDNPADVYLLREALTLQNATGVTLAVVNDGEEALDYIHRRGKFADAVAPDLIVLDLNLPKSDGSDVLRSVREQADLSTTPVVILTSSDSPRDRAAIEKLGADQYITKPSDLDAFLALGERLLGYLPARTASA